jgi:non-ribosomal peptide synthetase component E (peptide arylation enzyme)
MFRIGAVPVLSLPAHREAELDGIFGVALSMGLNFIAIILAVAGVLNPVIGALVHNAGSVAVVLNSALLLNFIDK